MIDEIFRKVWELTPLIHCITNPISINQCANAILSCGGRPIMAEHPGEVEEITATAGALLLNLGNITDARMESMPIAAAAARRAGIPWVLDAVGAACSSLRRRFIASLLSSGIPSLIKGNYSEIMALWRPDYSASGVDADGSLKVEPMTKIAAGLASRMGTIVLASGATDIVTDGSKTLLINNGTPQLGSVTGTGCMLGALCACAMAVESGVRAPAAAAALLGISGETAETGQGPGSFMTGLMDAIYAVSKGGRDSHLKIQEA